MQKIKLDVGTVYQKEEGGIYFFRYQVNGTRKTISLKTRNQKEALKEARKQIPLLKASSTEIIAAHVQHTNIESAFLKTNTKMQLISIGLPYEFFCDLDRKRTPYDVCISVADIGSHCGTDLQIQTREN